MIVLAKISTWFPSSHERRRECC